MKYGFGVDLGGTTVKLAFLRGDGTLLDRWEIPTDLSGQGANILPGIAASIGAYLARHPVAPEELLGTGIGVPGAVLPDGTVEGCENLGWARVDVTGVLHRLLGMPVRACNDAGAAALGESWMGSGSRAACMLLVTFGTGVGGGIVFGGRLWSGSHGASGEIGHMTLNREETEPCSCGKYGCVEQYCSATGIVRMAGRMLAASPQDSALRRLPVLTCKDIFDCSADADPLAMQVTDRFFRYAGEFLANVCAVLDPDVIVLGGGVSRAGPMLVEGILPYFRKSVYFASRATQLRLAELGSDAGVFGAFRLLLDEG